MFKNTKAFSGFSVNDLQKAKDFYGQILGLDVSDASMGLLQLNIAGGTVILVYPKPNHTPATFTILNFPVEDIEAVMNSPGVACVLKNTTSQTLRQTKRAFIGVTKAPK